MTSQLCWHFIIHSIPTFLSERIEERIPLILKNSVFYVPHVINWTISCAVAAKFRDCYLPIFKLILFLEILDNFKLILNHLFVPEFLTFLIFAVFWTDSVYNTWVFIILSCKSVLYESSRLVEMEWKNNTRLFYKLREEIYFL